MKRVGDPFRDRTYMAMALRLARRGLGRTRPNPVVGCVIVQGERVVGRGWHQRAGGAHAEVEALNDAGELAAGAEVFVSLEPCAHHGRTPPCVDALIMAKVARVVVAMVDPNPLVAGRGVEWLQKAGIKVTSGVMEAEANALNRPFITWITQKRPMVTLKSASSLDGKIATQSGESRWITGEAARLRGHRLRDIHDAVGVGIGTVLADNPRLNTRFPYGRDSIRLVVDSTLRIDQEAAIFFSSTLAPLWIATTDRSAKEKREQLDKAPAVEILLCKATANGRVDLHDLLQQLGEREVTSLLLEGGGILTEGFLREKLVDRLALFISPRLIGGDASPGIWMGQGVEHLHWTPRVVNMTIEHVGEDICMMGDVVYPAT